MEQSTAVLTECRPILLADLTLYFRTDGDDVTGDGSADDPSKAYQTISKCAAVANLYDFNGFSITIQHGIESGLRTFTENITLRNFIGGGTLFLSGQGPASTKITSTTGNTITLQVMGQTQFMPKNLYIDASNGSAFKVSYMSLLSLGNNVTFGSCNQHCVWVHDRQAIFQCLNNGVHITGTSQTWLFVQYGHVFVEQNAIFLDGSPTFSLGFIRLVASSAQVIGNTYSGSGTGKRYNNILCSVLNLNGVGESTALPGGLSASGTKDASSVVN